VSFMSSGQVRLFPGGNPQRIICDFVGRLSQAAGVQDGSP